MSGVRREHSTIYLSKATKDELSKLKKHPRETYEDVIKRLLEVYLSLPQAQRQR